MEYSLRKTLRIGLEHPAPAPLEASSAPIRPATHDVPALWHSPFHRALMLLLMAASLVPIWSATYFPSQNGPWHLLTIQMLHEYNNPAFNYAEFYVPSIHAIPHLAHTLLVYGLAFVFPLLVAHKIAISVYAVLLPTSVFWFLATVNRSRMAAGYASFLLIYNLPFLRGYHDYVMGIPLVLLTLTYWLRNRHQMTSSRIAVTMLLIVCVYFSHVFNFAILGLAMLVLTLYEARTVRTIMRLALLFVPASLLVADFVLLNVRQAQWVDRQDVTWLAPHTAAEGFFLNFFYTVSQAAYVLTFVPLMFGAYFLFRSLKRNYRRSGRSVYRAVVGNPWTALFVLCLALYFVTPNKLVGWHYVNVRFIPYVLLFAIAGFSVSGHLARRAAVVTVAIASLGIYALVAMNIRQANEGLEEYLSGVNKMRANSVILPLSFESFEVGRIEVLAHAHDYYSLFRGGANGKGIAQFNTLTPMVYRSYPTSRLFPSWQPSRPDDLGEVSRIYDYVVVWGRDSTTDGLLRNAAFDLVHEQGRLRLFENRRRRPVQQAAGHE